MGNYSLREAVAIGGLSPPRSDVDVRKLLESPGIVLRDPATPTTATLRLRLRLRGLNN